MSLFLVIYIDFSLYLKLDSFFFLNFIKVSEPDNFGCLPPRPCSPSPSLVSMLQRLEDPTLPSQSPLQLWDVPVTEGPLSGASAEMQEGVER